jgi:hypothetical protein
MEGLLGSYDRVFPNECVGCGRNLGVICFALSGEPLPEPDWPFAIEGCPLCVLRTLLEETRDQLLDLQEDKSDRLTARLLALREKERHS